MKKIVTVVMIFGLLINLHGQDYEKKLALVIGNAAYQNSGSLKNPVNDANLLASTLQEFGFKVTKLTDANLKQMQEAAIEFTREITNYDIALFYYAGHGVQVNGINYLVPVDAKMENELSAKYEAFDISDINYAFAQNNKNMNVMVLDACRNNPFRSWMRGGSRGFRALREQASGTLIAFATREGETASDGKGNNGLFTEKLVEQMKKPQGILDVFQNTRVAVLEASNNSQCPQEWNMLTKSSFSFVKKNNWVTNKNLKYGSLVLESELSGSFYLDNEFIDNITPQSQGKMEKLKPGKHLIEIKGTVYWKKEIEIIADKTITVTAESRKIIEPLRPKKENEFKDFRDNTIYKIVKIGDKLWMSENLNYEMENSWCYDDNPENCKKYGRLYTYESAKHVCPTGWHLPSDEEWKDLETTLGIDQHILDKTNFRGKVGIKLKSKTDWYKNQGLDELGFNVLPGGMRNYEGKGGFTQLKKQSFFWSSTPKGSNNAWRRQFHYSNDGIARMNFNAKYAYSVRCVKD